MLLSLTTASALLPCATRSGAAARYEARTDLVAAARCDARMGLFDAFKETPEQKAATEQRKEADFQNQQDILRRRGPRGSRCSGGGTLCMGDRCSLLTRVRRRRDPSQSADYLKETDRRRAASSEAFRDKFAAYPNLALA